MRNRFQTLLSTSTHGVSKVRSEPDLALPPIEDTAALTWLNDGPGMSGKSMSPTDRRKKLAKIIRDAKKSRDAAAKASGGASHLLLWFS